MIKDYQDFARSGTAPTAETRNSSKNNGQRPPPSHTGNQNVEHRPKTTSGDVTVLDNLNASLKLNKYSSGPSESEMNLLDIDQHYSAYNFRIGRSANVPKRSIEDHGDAVLGDAVLGESIKDSKFTAENSSDFISQTNNRSNSRQYSSPNRMSYSSVNSHAGSAYMSSAPPVVINLAAKAKQQQHHSPKPEIRKSASRPSRNKMSTLSSALADVGVVYGVPNQMIGGSSAPPRSAATNERDRDRDKDRAISESYDVAASYIYNEQSKSLRIPKSTKSNVMSSGSTQREASNKSSAGTNVNSKNNGNQSATNSQKKISPQSQATSYSSSSWSTSSSVISVNNPTATSSAVGALGTASTRTIERMLSHVDRY